MRSCRYRLALSALGHRHRIAPGIPDMLAVLDQCRRLRHADL